MAELEEKSLDLLSDSPLDVEWLNKETPGDEMDKHLLLEIIAIKKRFFPGNDYKSIHTQCRCLYDYLRYYPNEQDLFCQFLLQTLKDMQIYKTLQQNASSQAKELFGLDAALLQHLSDLDKKAILDKIAKKCALGAKDSFGFKSIELLMHCRYKKDSESWQMLLNYCHDFQNEEEIFFNSIKDYIYNFFPNIFLRKALSLLSIYNKTEASANELQDTILLNHALALLSAKKLSLISNKISNEFVQLNREFIVCLMVKGLYTAEYFEYLLSPDNDQTMRSKLVQLHARDKTVNLGKQCVKAATLTINNKYMGMNHAGFLYHLTATPVILTATPFIMSGSAVVGSIRGRAGRELKKVEELKALFINLNSLADQFDLQRALIQMIQGQKSSSEASKDLIKTCQEKSVSDAWNAIVHYMTLSFPDNPLLLFNNGRQLFCRIFDQCQELAAQIQPVSEAKASGPAV
jgi:hypothetical protein